MSESSNDKPDQTEVITRRSVLTAVTAAGIGTAGFSRALAQEAVKSQVITVESIQNAEWVAGIELTDEQREEAVAAVNGVISKRRQLRAVPVDYDTLPALRFDPEMFAVEESANKRPDWLLPASPAKPHAVAEELEDYSYLSIRQLGRLLRDKKVTAVQLAESCLKQLQEVDPILKCVVTLTRDLAMKQAERADRELAEGKDRGPLHGIPWGAKDLIAVEGYPTTWGAPQFREQTLPRTATVAMKLEDAGAVLVAKLSLGALAMGDKWFGGMTRNPWNPDRGSSGSSAGSASAVAAGVIPFALGSETLGSIVSPCRRCGVTGLRPTFGRVSRKDCMALSWSMDKIGPIARRIDDCGIVFNTIHGADHGDPTSVDRWFEWPVKTKLDKLKIGRVEGVTTSPEDEMTLQALEKLGAQIVPVTLPDEFPEWAMSLMLDAEAAEIFHQLVAEDNTDGLNHWGTIFRKLHFLPAVDYLHAARLRTKLVKAMAEVFKQVDMYVGGSDLGICNLTGHPTVVFPTVMSDYEDHSQPVCSTLTGRLHDEATLLAVAQLVEATTDVSQKRPVLHRAQ